jgi:hypothetical protein
VGGAAPGELIPGNNVNSSYMKKPLLVFPIIFVGILGVIGMYEDVAVLQWNEVWGETKIYGKYFAAVLGSISYVFVQYARKSRIDDGEE